jgi:hypothetical protein
MQDGPRPLDAPTLNRLLTDRALGALSADVEQLLGSYLTFDSRAEEDSRRIARTVELARAVLCPPAGRSDDFLPPLSAAEGAARPRAVLRRVVGPAMALAACLIAGFALGKRMSGPGPSVAMPTNPTHMAQRPSEAPPAKADKPATGLWSLRRMYESMQNAPEREPSGVIWISPRSQPQLGGRS